MAGKADESYFLGKLPYVPIISIPNNVNVDINARIEDLTVCLLFGKCIEKLQVTNENVIAGIN